MRPGYGISCARALADTIHAACRLPNPSAATHMTRPETTLVGLAALKPVREGGTVTAGNADRRSFAAPTACVSIRSPHPLECALTSVVVNLPDVERKASRCRAGLWNLE